MEYYGFLEEYKKVDSKEYFLAFDIISDKDMEYILDTKDDILTSEILDEINTFHLEVLIDKNVEKEFKDLTRRRPREGQWYRIKLKEQGEIPTYIYSSINADEGNERFISDIEFINGNSKFGRSILDAISLYRFDSTDEEINEDTVAKKIESVINNIEKPSLVKVFNVGQGACNALCDFEESPLMYFDFGKGITSNLYNFPNSYTFCFKNNPPIVLSHWHKDHWASGEKFDYSLNTPWIVPRQRIGTSHLKLAKKLNDRGNLHIWPDNLYRIPFFGGYIMKNTGNNMNNSGLSLFSSMTDCNNCFFESLLPGDCEYRYVPFSSVSLNGLVATHHGGKYMSGNTPQSTKHSHHIAYSYGNQNTYNHPSTHSINKHENNGWINRSNTINGDVILNHCICQN